jgi:hypothetical protein
VLEHSYYLVVRSIAQVGPLDRTQENLQNRKENTVSSMQLSDFALDHPAVVRLIAPLQNRIKIPKTNNQEN